MTASGTFGFGEEFADFTDLEELGAVVVKGTTLQPRRGNDGVRIAETPAGMLNCIGLENPGAEYFLQTILPRISKYHMNVIVNISGGSAEEYGQLAERLDVPGVAAIELNVSCPNVKDGGIIFGTDPKAAAEVVTQAKKHTKKPVILKLSPNVTDIAEMARAGEAAGADALSLINTLMGMAIDIRTWRPVLGNITGGLSGPCVKPVALRMVWQASQAVRIPVIGMGGITTWEDAVEMLIAGATALQIGTVLFSDPYAPIKINEGINNFLDKNGIKSVTELSGTVIPW